MTSSLRLPQQETGDSERQKRQKKLEKQREAYAFKYSYRGAIATIVKLPSSEKFGIDYILRMLWNLLPLALSLPRILWAALKALFCQNPFKNYGDYVFFACSPMPDREFLWDFLNDDAYFGYQRVAGVNPLVIEGVESVERLPTPLRENPKILAQLPAALETLIAEQKLYVADYAMLQAMAATTGMLGTHRKYLAAPLALFLLQDNGWLRPLAIHLDRNAADSVFTPADGQDWVAARAYAQAADFTHHELWSHATHVHYVMEAFILASHRQLSTRHPLFALLDLHFDYTLAVNDNPLFEKTADGKTPAFGQMFGGSYDGMIDFMAQGMRAFSFQDAALPRDIERRRMGSPKLHYPYRDDGRLLWNALETFARQYLAQVYRHEDDLAGDTELQAWAAELATPTNAGGLGIGGFPSGFTALADLVAVVTQILFLATAHHSAVHFTQYQYAGLLPQMPGAVYAPPPSSNTRYWFLRDVLKLLPPFGIAFYQMFIFYMTDFRVNRIGEYDLSRFDADAKTIIKAHQNALKAISKTIGERNQTRPLPYKPMDPACIPNSVSI